MDGRSDATALETAGERPGSNAAPAVRRAEALVTALAVAAVCMAGLLAAVMQTRADADARHATGPASPVLRSMVQGPTVAAPVRALHSRPGQG